jgi:sodium/hydrogen antiporter
VFGALIDPTFLATIGTRGYAFAVLLLILVRPLALPLALAGSQLERLEYAAAAWFGPKGFASVVYGVLILQSGIPRADELFHLVALPVAISILAHSSTDVLIARQFHKKRVAEEHSGQTEHAEESQTQ